MNKVPTDYQTDGKLHEAKPEFDAHSKTFNDYYGPLFKGEQLGRFKLLPEFPAATNWHAPIPKEVVSKMADGKSDVIDYPGAYSTAGK